MPAAGVGGWLGSEVQIKHPGKLACCCNGLSGSYWSSTRSFVLFCFRWQTPQVTLSYFPRLIKNERRGLPPALTRVSAARHTNTRAGSGGPPGHSGALFSAVHETPPSRNHQKLVYSMPKFGNLTSSHEDWMAQGGCYLGSCDSDA